MTNGYLPNNMMFVSLETERKSLKEHEQMGQI